MLSISPLNLASMSLLRIVIAGGPHSSPARLKLLGTTRQRFTSSSSQLVHSLLHRAIVRAIALITWGIAIHENQVSNTYSSWVRCNNIFHLNVRSPLTRRDFSTWANYLNRVINIPYYVVQNAYSRVGEDQQGSQKLYLYAWHRQFWSELGTTRQPPASDRPWAGLYICRSPSANTINHARHQRHPGSPQLLHFTVIIIFPEVKCWEDIFEVAGSCHNLELLFNLLIGFALLIGLMSKINVISLIWGQCISAPILIRVNRQSMLWQ
jgi:hypothetical protein